MPIIIAIVIKFKGKEKNITNKYRSNQWVKYFLTPGLSDRGRPAVTETNTYSQGDAPNLKANISSSSWDITSLPVFSQPSEVGHELEAGFLKWGDVAKHMSQVWCQNVKSVFKKWLLLLEWRLCYEICLCTADNPSHEFHEGWIIFVGEEKGKVFVKKFNPMTEPKESVESGILFLYPCTVELFIEMYSMSKFLVLVMPRIILKEKNRHRKKQFA